jgi:hypothetical protein
MSNQHDIITLENVKEEPYRTTAKAYAVYNGTEEPDPRDKEKKRLKLFWLPKRFVVIHAEENAIELPEWLAIDRGLV